MTIEFIIQAAQQRGVELLKMFPHQNGYKPSIEIDSRSHKAILSVESSANKTQRGFPINTLTQISQSNARDVLWMIYRECVEELRKK